MEAFQLLGILVAPNAFNKETTVLRFARHEIRDPIANGFPGTGHVRDRFAMSNSVWCAIALLHGELNSET
jgi:hypothetical protein